MDIGLDTLIYIIIGIMFVLGQATRKNVEQVPPVANDNLSFQHVEPTESGNLRYDRDFFTPDNLIGTGSDKSARPPDIDREAVPLDLRTAVVHSVILKRNYA